MGFNLGSIYASVGLNTMPLKSGIAQSQKMMGGLDKSMAVSSKGIGSTLVTGFKKFAKVSVVALAAVGVASVSMAASFDKSMREVNSLIRLGEGEFKKFKTAVLDMSTSVEHSADELAQGMYWIVSAMPDASDSEGLKVLEASSRLATAGVADMADSADLMTTAINAWGLAAEDTEHVSDVLLKIVERGKTTIPELAANFSKAATSAAMMGVPIEDLGAVLATLTRIGIPADRALMGLNRTILGMAKPSKAASEWINSIGFESGQTMMETIGLEGVLTKLHESFGNNVDAMAELFPNIRELMVLLPTTGKNFGDVVKDMESFDDVAGTTNEMFGEMTETIQYKWAVAVDKAKKVLIELGEKLLPVVSDGIDALTRIIEGDNEAFNTFADALKTAGTALYHLGQFIFDVKPLLYGLAGAFAAVKIARFVGGITGAATSVGVLGNAFANLSLVGGVAPIAGFAASLASIALVAAPAAAAIGVFAYQTWQTDKAAQAAWDGIQALDKEHGELGLTLQSLVGRQQELNAKLTEGTAPAEELAAAEAELKTIRAEIAAQFPTMVEGFDAEGEAILKSDEALKDHIDSLLRYSGIAKSKTTGEMGDLEALYNKRAKLQGQMSEWDTAIAKMGTSLDALEIPGLDSATVMGDLATDFDKGRKSVTDWMKRAQEAGDVDIVNSTVFSDLDKLDALLLETGGSLGELQAEFGETATAAGQMAKKLNDAAYQAGLAGGTMGEEFANNLIKGLNSVSPEFRQAALNNLAKYLQGQLEMRGVATTEAGAMAQDMANAFVSGGEWDSKGSEAGEEVMTNLQAELDAFTPTTPPIESGGVNTASYDASLRDIQAYLETKSLFGPAIQPQPQGPPVQGPPSPGEGGGGMMLGAAAVASMTGDIDQLSSAWTTLLHAVDGFWELMETKDWKAMNEMITAEFGPQALGAWWELHGAYDTAKAKLDEYSDAIVRHEKNIANLTDKQQKLNESLQKHQQELSRLSQIKIKGETAADEKSFKLQQKSNALQLAILKAEKERDFEKAAMLTLDKERVDKAKELHDLQTDVDFAGQRREIQQMLDPLHGQEMTRKELVKAIKAEQKAISEKQAQLEEVEVAIKAEQDALIKVKEEFDNAKVHVDSFKNKIDDMSRHFLEKMRELQSAAQDLGGAISGTGGGSYAGAGRMGGSGARAPEMMGGYGVTVNVPLYIDGKEVAYATTRVTGSNASRYARSGGRY